MSNISLAIMPPKGSVKEKHPGATDIPSDRPDTSSSPISKTWVGKVVAATSLRIVGLVHMQRANRLLSTLEVLHSSLMILRCLECIKRTKISPLPCLRIFFTRIQTVFARTKLSDHRISSATRSATFLKDCVEFKPCAYEVAPSLGLAQRRHFQGIDWTATLLTATEIPFIAGSAEAFEERR